MKLLHPRQTTLDAFSTGHLPAAARERVTRHLAGCPRCRKQTQTLGRIELALAPDHIFNDDITRRLLASLGPAEWRHERLIGELHQVIGICRIEPAHGGEPADGFDGLGLKPGDRLRVADEGLARLELSDGSQIWVDRQTEATLDERDGSLELRKGRLFAQMRPQAAPYRIQTPSALLTVLGTTFEATVTPYESTLLRVLEGRVAYRNEAGEAVVPRRKQVDAAAHQRPRLLPIRRPREVGAWICALADPLNFATEGGATIMSGVATMPGAAWGRTERYWRTGLTAAGIALLLLAGSGGALYWHGSLPGVFGRGGRASEHYQEPRHTTLEPDAPLVATGVRWPVGARFTHRMELTSRSENQLPGRPQPVLQELRQTQEVTFTVVARTPAGEREVDARFGNIQLNLTQGDQRLFLDTTAESFKDSRHPFAAILRAQLAARFRLYLSAAGRIERIDGFDAFRQAVLGQIGSEPSGLVAPLLNEDAYRRMFGRFVVPDLPSGPLPIGRQWTTESGNPAAPAMQEQYTFERWDLFKGHRCAMLKVTLNAVSKTGPAPARTAGGPTMAAMTIEATPMATTTTGSGRIWFDPEIGMAVKTAWSMDKQVTMSLPSQPKTTAAQSVHGTVTQYLASNLLDVESKP